MARGHPRSRADCMYFCQSSVVCIIINSHKSPSTSQLTTSQLNSYLNGSTIALIKLNYSTIPMKKIHNLNVLTYISQLHNPAGLRRFPSPHPSFFLDFLWNFWAQMRREWGSRAYIGGHSRSPEGGACGWAPLSPVGGATGPPCTHAPPAKDLFVN